MHRDGALVRLQPREQGLVDGLNQRLRFLRPQDGDPAVEDETGNTGKPGLANPRLVRQDVAAPAIARQPLLHRRGSHPRRFGQFHEHAPLTDIQAFFEECAKQTLHEFARAPSCSARSTSR